MTEIEDAVDDLKLTGERILDEEATYQNTILDLESEISDLQDEIRELNARISELEG